MGDERTVASLTRLERAWLKKRRCSFCETSCLSDMCFAHSGSWTLPVIEGVRDEEKTIDLGEPCNMDERRAAWLKNYKPKVPETADA